MIAWRECWFSTPVSCDHGIVHLDCWSIKIFSHFWGFCPLWFWPFGAFVLWRFLSIFAFLCPPTRLHDENVDYPHLYHVIMGSCTLIVGVLKYFLIFGVLSALILIVWLFRPVVLLSIFGFLCKPTWSHDENVDCPHLYQVIMGSYTLIVGVLKYFLIFGGFLCFDCDPFLAFVLWCFCPLLFFSVRPRDRMTRMLIIHTCIMWSWDRAPWLLEYYNIFSFLVVLSALILIVWGFRPVLLLSIFGFLCPPTWSHDENVDYLHLYQVIMGSYTLIVGVLKYFLIFGGFLCFDCDPFLAFVLWCFCPFLLFSVRPRDRMTRMLIIHTCIMWSWDRAPWLLEY